MYQGKNRYFKNPKISEGRFRRLLKAFALDLTASDAPRLTDISICSLNTIYLRMRLRIAVYC
jgi:transposase